MSTVKTTTCVSVNEVEFDVVIEIYVEEADPSVGISKASADEFELLKIDGRDPKLVDNYTVECIKDAIDQLDLLELANDQWERDLPCDDMRDQIHDDWVARDVGC